MSGWRRGGSGGIGGAVGGSGTDVVGGWVVAISGSAGAGGAVPLNAVSLVWSAGSTTVGLSQTIAVVNTAPSAMTIAAQSASLTSTTGTAANTTGANLVLAAGAGSSGNGGVWQSGSINLVVNAPSAAGTEAYVNVQRVSG